jgi:hypothetical protein
MLDTLITYNFGEKLEVNTGVRIENSERSI